MEATPATIAILRRVLLRCVQIMWMTCQRRRLLLPCQAMNCLLHRMRSSLVPRWAHRQLLRPLHVRLSCRFPPHVAPDHTAHQREERHRSNLPADRCCCPGRVYSRRTRADTSTRPKLTGSGQTLRFRPGFVYSRRRVRGPNTSVPRLPCMTSRHPTVESEVHVDDSTMNDESLPALRFVEGISQPLPQPLMQVPPR